MTTRDGRLRHFGLRRLPWLAGASMLGASLPWWQAWVPTPTGRWLADLAVHWQWLYLLAGLGAAALWLVLSPPAGRSGAAAVLGVMAALAALNLGWAAMPRLPQASADDLPARTVKLLSFNVNLDNQATDDVLRWIDGEQPDALALLEVTPAMQPLLDALTARYPNAVMRPRDDPFGMAVFSRHAWAGERLVDDGAAPPRFVALVQAPGGPFTLQVIHPMPPISAADRAARDALLARLAHAPASTVLMGDFNTTPWSDGLRRMGDAGWARATGLTPTFALARSLPIDHILATRAHWRVVDAGTGPWLGSDHRPVWAVLQHAAPAQR